MQTHTEKRLLPYHPEQMYELVADVEKYPEFLPWCKTCHTISETDEEILAELTVGFKFFSETFTSRVLLKPFETIDVVYLNGPFRHMINRWTFTPSIQDDETFCIVDFFIEFEFKSRILQSLIQGFFTEAVHKMVRAFENRAVKLYS